MSGLINLRRKKTNPSLNQAEHGSKECKSSFSKASPSPSNPEKKLQDKQNQREILIESMLKSTIIDIHKLREVTWSGVPDKFRAEVWQLLLDYMPVNINVRKSTLSQKRNDYYDSVNRIFADSHRHLWTNAQKEIDMQIMKDLPRSKHPLLRNLRVQKILERILFVWSVRHPASGYVQGMNDVLQPFFLAFIFPYIWKHNNVTPDCMVYNDQEANVENLEKITEDELNIIEADCFWCFSKLLDGLQDLYTKNQPGLYEMLHSLSHIIERVNQPLAEWIKKEDIQYQEFAFRWMNCLLVREFSSDLLFRLWDTYLSSYTKISSTHLYVCAAYLVFLSPKVINLPHADFIISIQSISPQSWSRNDMEEIIAQAYIYDRMFSDSPSHLQSRFL